MYAQSGIEDHLKYMDSNAEALATAGLLPVQLAMYLLQWIMTMIVLTGQT